MVRRAACAWLLPRRRRLRDGVYLNPQNADGFLESLSVIAIVACLLAYAAAAYPPALLKAALIEAASLASIYKTEVALDLAATGRPPESIMALDERPMGGRYFSGFEWIDNELIAVLAPRWSAGFAGDETAPGDAKPLTLAFRIAQTPEGRTLFLCGRASPPAGFTAAPARHTTLPETYLPFFCRN